MKRQSLTNYAAVLSATVVVAALNVAQAYAVGSVTQGVDAAHGDQQPSNLFGNAGVFSTISNVLLFIVGAVAVIMIIIGGLRYVVSGGDASQVQAAKNIRFFMRLSVSLWLFSPMRRSISSWRVSFQMPQRTDERYRYFCPIIRPFSIK